MTLNNLLLSKGSADQTASKVRRRRCERRAAPASWARDSLSLKAPGNEYTSDILRWHSAEAAEMKATAVNELATVTV